jgi:DNA-binding transcriptional MerR regulator/methylmalonyl-CoA mutase cobalamin-binding subunit
MRKQAQSGSVELFPIRTVANLTGVNAITLRAWERRHGLVKPVRSDGGQRMYRREEIDLIHRIVGLLDKGIPIGRVALALTDPSASNRPARHSPWDAYRERIISAIGRFDEDEVEEVYNAALALHPLQTVTSRLLLPLLRELGRRWETGQGTVAEEHFFSVYLRNKLGARFHHRSRAGRGHRLLVACFPGEQHELGLLMFSLIAADHGLQVVMLAANVPLAELPNAAKWSRCDAIVLSATMAPDHEVMAEELPRAVKAANVPVFVGGVASIRERDRIVASGAEPLGTDIGAAIQRIATSLPSAAEP